MQVRVARLEDASAVARLSAELGEVLRGAGSPLGAALSKAEIVRDGFGSSPAFGVIVAELDGLIAGYLLHHPSYDPDLGGRATAIVDLCVSAVARRRGVGRALVDAALEHARQVGSQALSWRVRPSNRGAMAFYESLGASVDAGPVCMHLPVVRGSKG